MRTTLFSLLAGLLLFSITARSADPLPAGGANSRFTGPSVLPPPLRSVTRDAALDAAAGETIFLDDGEKQFSLFVPAGWKAPASTDLALTVHFSGDFALVASEYLRGGLTTPLVIVTWGSGTETYRVPFLNADRFGGWLKLVLEKLKERGVAAETRISVVDFSAYGGGYGAIREILKSAEHVALIRRVILCDAIYASYTKDRDANDSRMILEEHLTPWMTLVKAAAKGERTFVTSFSQVETVGYASCAEVSGALAKRAGNSLERVELDSCAAANEEDFPLLYRADVGHFHAWGYSGVSDEAHLVHLEHLGDIWRTLEEAGAP